VNQETLKLVENKANKSGVYMLNSPKHGYGRRGIKSSFRDRGAIGPRGEAINDLIERMI
jgi:hypothetical protein